ICRAGGLARTIKLTGTTTLPWMDCGEEIVMLPRYVPGASPTAFAVTFTVVLPEPDVALNVSHDPPTGVATLVDADQVKDPMPSSLMFRGNWVVDLVSSVMCGGSTNTVADPSGTGTNCLTTRSIQSAN